MKTGRNLIRLSLVSRLGVLLLLLTLAFLSRYVNYKIGFNNARLVGLSEGFWTAMLYRLADGFFSLFSDPVGVMQTNGGMTWSIRLFGLPFTDPIAFLSVLVKNRSLETGFVLGLFFPVGFALLFGRVFCSFVCPASLLFYSINRLRRLLGSFFFFPNLKTNPAVAWGILAGGLASALLFGHGIWIFVLPYFALGQTIFHGVAFGTVTAAALAVIGFALLDLFLGNQFTCRNLCPTGRLLGFLGRKSLYRLKREEKNCLTNCHTCEEVCSMQLSPKLDRTADCTMCGECLLMCPADCLSIDRKSDGLDPLKLFRGKANATPN